MILISMLILLIIILCIINIYININNIEGFTSIIDSDITFLEPNELKEILIQDKDNYYDRFYDYDMKARNVKNKEEYLYNIKHTLLFSSWTIEQKEIVEKAIANIHIKIKKSKDLDIDITNIPWIIGLTNDSYENGYPHTRGNVIILNIKNIYSSNLMETLIHEKIHVYQKMYPDITNNIIKKLNFKLVGKRKYSDMIRVNPDTDDNIYSYNNNMMKAQYTSINPTSIADIKYNISQEQSYEHPYEWMAIDIAKKIVKL